MTRLADEGPTKPADPLTVLATSERSDPRGPTTAAETGPSLSGLQAAVDRARGQVADEHYDKAERTLIPVFEYVRQHKVPDSKVGNRQLVIISASAHSLLGSCLDFAGRSEEAQENFLRSVELFVVAVASGKLSARDWADYGEALAALGDCKAAIDALSQARSLGFRSAESLRRLGALYVRQGMRPEGEIVLREAVDLTTVDWESASLLAAARELDGRVDGAAEMFVEAGRRAAAVGRLTESLEAFKRAAQLTPSDPIPFQGVGEILRVLGQAAEAREALNVALKLDPASGWTLATRGRVRLALGETDGAIEDLTGARSLEPSLDWIPAELALALRNAGRTVQARGVIDEALEQMPGSVPLLTARAELLWFSGQLVEALGVIEEALALAPEESWQLALKGELLRSLGRPKKALAALERALRSARAPFPWALATKGQTLRALGRAAEARTAFEEALRLDPRLRWAREELAALLLEQGEHAAALAEVEQVLDEAPDSVAALTLKAQILLALRRNDESGKAAADALAFDEANIPARLVLAEGLRSDGRSETALHEVDHAVALDQASGDAHALRARLLLDTGRPDEALDELRRSVALDPDNVERVEELARVLRRRGRFSEARSELEQALERTPQSPLLLRMLGYVLLDLVQFEDAASTFTLLQAVAPDSPWVHADLAFAEDRRGACRAALQALGPALEADDELPWTLIVHGIILGDVGEFGAAVEPLQRACLLAPDGWLSHHALAWTLEQLGSDYASEAHAAYRRAYELDRENLFSLLGVAKTRQLDEAHAAADEYRDVIERGAKLGPHPALISVLGLCNSYLGRHDEAMDLILRAISLWPHASPAAVGDHLNLGLASLASGRHDLALAQYVRACRLSEALEPERRHGVLAVAVSAINWAIAHDHVQPTTETERALSQLTALVSSLDDLVRVAV